MQQPDLFSAGAFNHCSCLCRHQDGVMLTWYAGSTECHDDQSVYIIFINRRIMSKPFCIGPMTGNPVIWQSGETITILWAEFTTKERHPVNRWKHCQLWLQKYIYDRPTEQITPVNEKQPLGTPSDHLLGRCTPISYNNRILLPLYDEENHTGIIMSGDINGHFKSIATIGQDTGGMIQPTIWERDGIIHSLSRNIGVRRTYSMYSSSTDGGQSWTPPVSTTIYNKNNSLQVISKNMTDYIIWNDSPIGRDNLRLGLLDGLQISHSIKLASKYGSYPTMCFDTSGRLHVAYTTIYKTIAHRCFNERTLKRQLRSGNIARRDNHRTISN